MRGGDVLEFWGAAVRRWYVLALCMIVTALVFLSVLSRPEVYSGRVTIAVLAPQTVDRSTLQRADAALLASMAVIEVNGSPHHLVSASSNTTLYGRGVTRGTVVRLEHGGNQWKPDVPRPYVIVEATDQSAAAVEQRLEQATAELTGTIRRIESDFDVRGDQRVQIVNFSGKSLVTWVPTSPSRAALGSALMGLFLALWAVPLADRLLSRWKLRRRGQSSPA